MKKLARFSGFSVSVIAILSSAADVFADATASAGIGGGEGTGSSLPDAGTSGFTYLIFAAGALLFIWGMTKLALSYRDIN